MTTAEPDGYWDALLVSISEPGAPFPLRGSRLLSAFEDYKTLIIIRKPVLERDLQSKDARTALATLRVGRTEGKTSRSRQDRPAP